MRAHLGNHHVAVKGAAAVVLGRPIDEAANLGDDGRAKSHVGNEMAIPEVLVRLATKVRGAWGLLCWMMLT